MRRIKSQALVWFSLITFWSQLANTYYPDIEYTHLRSSKSLLCFSPQYKSPDKTDAAEEILLTKPENRVRHLNYPSLVSSAEISRPVKCQHFSSTFRCEWDAYTYVEINNKGAKEVDHKGNTWVRFAGLWQRSIFHQPKRVFCHQLVNLTKISKVEHTVSQN